MSTTNSTEIQTFLSTYSSEVQELAAAARNFMAKALPTADETLDPSWRLLAYSYGPGYKGLLCSLLFSKSGIKLGISHSATLPDPRQLLQGSGEVHRHFPLAVISDLNQPGLKSLIKAAVAAWKERNLDNC